MIKLFGLTYRANDTYGGAATFSSKVLYCAISMGDRLLLSAYS